MTIREKIEAVLRKHGIIPGLEITKFGASSISDDLLSCFPQPSLKTLERIFELHDHKYGSKAEWLKAVQFDILRWANGNWSEPRIWCEHLKQNLNMVKETWEFISWPMVLTTSWQFCPICGAKRPMEAQ